MPFSWSRTMKQEAMEGVAPFIPKEIITNILKLLPVKALIRFQCVCKHWKNLIKSPPFIAAHLEHCIQYRPCLLFQTYFSLKRLELYILNCDMQFFEVQNIPELDSKAWIAGSCNGLLCLQIDRSSYGISPRPPLLLWNPSLREVKQVPISEDALGDYDDDDYHIGFGFSPIINDYKIVRFYVSSREYQVQHVKVYSLGGGSWKNIEVGNLDLGNLGPACTFNGGIFWFSTQYIEDRYEYNIVSFDIAMEVFSLIPVPAINLTNDEAYVTEFEHRLALLCYTEIEDPESCLIELWVLEDGRGGSGERWSWAQKYTSSPYPCFLIPRTIWRNKLIACSFHLLPGDEKHYEFVDMTVLSNFTNTKLKLLFRHGNFIFNYVESLIPVSNIHIQSEES
ncbi:hypothetical protein K1719_028776 [Acacia pycnantha]|nr:hypothetical protein K1719_028776 [Acacia pycnantha]